ncbi:S-layer homology domain-containing protein [Cohnella thailandensis]|uniref:S-layer homology domain-containing protein n=1 Tax=Cohnella thailandensis TaxID=557557 RepID=A0A841T2B6_9BACL|nr:S-layer homology domain-containing protein [Cohnella thailandensis]MBB6637732.1 S-layer homology domain-containing protein [Cohnella thailandensis]MBP1974091.1 hypothetical protein [Cohnella thailandensis]
MKKRISIGLSMLLIVSLLAGLYGPVPQAAAADEVWIEVGTATELNNIRNDLDGNYRLTADIDMSSFGDWEPIGDNIDPFIGKLDGNGHTISHLTIDKPNMNNVGMFRNVKEAEIFNVHFADIQVSGGDYVGGIAGDLMRSNLVGSSVEGSVTGNEAVGLLVGYNNTSALEDNFAAGQLQFGKLPNQNFGGIVGYMAGTGSQFATVTRSYAAVSIPSGMSSGGMIGYLEANGRVTSSYWDTEASGVPDLGGASDKTTAEMKLKSTYSGWDFANTWGMIEKSTYPLHRSDYLKVALDTLSVQNPDDDTELTLDRPFSSDYGVYSAHVENKVDRIDVKGIAMDGSSTVSVNGGTGSELTLVPGPNDFEIKVVAKNGLQASYQLTVNRDAGTEEYPHRITTAEQLVKIGDSAEGYGLDQVYRLDADLDLSSFGAGEGWEPIGSASEPFAGTFDGNGHVLLNLAANRSGSDDVGLFGYASGAAVKNVVLEDAQLTGNRNVGALIGHAVDSDVNSVSAKGAVSGNEAVGGLVGSLDSDSSVVESLSAVSVEGDTSAGGLVGSGPDGTVSASFWDKETSGQAASAGGGLGKSTAEMMAKTTYTGAGWSFGSGSWGLIEGTTYPMPMAVLNSVLLSGLTVTATGANVSPSFDPLSGTPLFSLDRPVGNATVSATAANAGATVTYNGDSAGNVALSLGENKVDIRIVAPGGFGQAVYRLAIIVPTPKPISVQAPSPGSYLLGDTLDFTVIYDHPVEVEGTPILPLFIGIGTRMAKFIGQPSGQHEKLNFRYTVQPGDLDTNGIGLDADIELGEDGSITALGKAVLLSLPAPPTLTNVIVNGLAPIITLTPSPISPTTGVVTVTVAATVSNNVPSNALAVLKWAKGSHTVADFADSAFGTDILTARAFQATENGTYTVYAADSAGNKKTETIEIANIVTGAPSIALIPSTTTLGNAAVPVSVVASVPGESSGNELAALKWAKGSYTASDFANPDFGTDILTAQAFQATGNGTYTVYAADLAGNKTVKTITISNIVTDLPTIVLNVSTTSPVSTPVEVTVSASVSGEDLDNKLTALKWAPGSHTESDFADPDFGTDILTAQAFQATGNGTYTVYAADLAGNKTVKTITISNIVTDLPTIALSPSATMPVNDAITVTVTATVSSAASGNELTALKWAPGSRAASDFADPDFGTDILTARAFKAMENGTYTVFAADSAGNKTVETIEISNIVTDQLTISLTPSATSPVNAAVTVTVTASVPGEASGNELTALKWVQGSYVVGDFADPDLGTDIPGTRKFQATENGTYTVYAADTAGNKKAETIEIKNIVTDSPTIALIPSATTPVNDVVPVTVIATVSGTASGNELIALKWAEGSYAASDFADPSFGTDIREAGAFQATENGIYTVYAADAAGNKKVERIEILNILSELPTITLNPGTTSIVNTPVEISVAATVYGEEAGNELAALKWAEGSYTTGDFADPAFGTDIKEVRTFQATRNGTYTVYAADSAGNRKAAVLSISNIVTELPTISLDYSPKESNQARVDISVSAAVYGEENGNRIAALKWAEGELGASAFDDTAFGTDVPESGLISVSRNGKYTVYAADRAGNKRTSTIEISNIGTAVTPSIPSLPVDPSLLDDYRFYLVPGQEYTLRIKGITLQIPAGAITQSMSIAMKKATGDAKKLLGSDQTLLSDAFSLTKDVEGRFALPVRISIQWTASELGADERPGLFYYDETAGQWVEIPSEYDGKTVTGQTDHFTLFAVLPVAKNEQPTFGDIAGHWAEKEIQDGLARGWVNGYPNGTFLPNKAVSRAEFAVMLSQALNLADGEPLTFADRVSIPAWASQAAASVVKAGILSGYGDHTFRPNENITREEATAMLARAAGLAAASTPRTSFADDAAIGNWAKSYVQAAFDAKLVLGQAGNRFQPQASTTRAEAVVLLLRLAAYLKLS